MTKYNSVENAETFLKEQIEWCLANGYKDFSVWSNGKELQCVLDNNDIATAMRRGELKRKKFAEADESCSGDFGEEASGFPAGL